MTLERYGHLLPDAAQRARVSVEQAWEEAGHGDTGTTVDWSRSTLDRRRKGATSGRRTASGETVLELPHRVSRNSGGT